MPIELSHDKTNRIDRALDRIFPRSLYETIFETINSPTIIIEEDATVSLVNKGFERLSGYSKGEVEGKKSLKEFIEKSCWKTIETYHRLRRIDSGKTPEHYECQIVDRNGDVKETHVSVAMIPETNKSVVSFLDITDRVRAQEALQESETKFRLLFQKSPDPFVILEGDRYIDCNEATCKIMHCTSKEQILGLSPLQISPERQPDGQLSSDKTKEVMELAINEGSSHFEWVHRNFDDELFWVEISLTAMSIGGKRYLYATGRDITKRKETEEALRESEGRYKTAIEHSNDGVMIVKDEKYIFVNQKLVKMLGYSKAEEIVGKHIGTIVHPDYLGKVVDRYRRRHRGEYVPSKYELKHVRKDGTPLDVEASVTKTIYKGEPVSLIYLRDITERKQTENELKKSEERYRKIFENAVECIFLTTPEGRFLTANPATARTFGFESAKEMIKEIMNIQQQLYVNPEDRTTMKTLLEKHGVLKNFETRMKQRDGKHIWISMNLHAIRDAEGKISCYEGTAIDITERKEAEEALRNREKELNIKSMNLEETNAALNVLLKLRENDKKMLESKILTNIKELVFPYLEKMKKGHLNENQATYLSILESGLTDIVSPFLQKMTSIYPVS